MSTFLLTYSLASEGVCFSQPLLPCRGSDLQAVARGRAVPGGEALYEYSVVAKCLALRAFRFDDHVAGGYEIVICLLTSGFQVVFIGHLCTDVMV